MWGIAPYGQAFRASPDAVKRTKLNTQTLRNGYVLYYQWLTDTMFSERPNVGATNLYLEMSTGDPQLCVFGTAFIESGETIAAETINGLLEEAAELKRARMKRELADQLKKTPSKSCIKRNPEVVPKVIQKKKTDHRHHAIPRELKGLLKDHPAVPQGTRHSRRPKRFTP